MYSRNSRRSSPCTPTIPTRATTTDFAGMKKHKRVVNLSSKSLTLRMSVVNVWRDEEEVGVGDVWKGRSARALAWGDVDPH